MVFRIGTAVVGLLFIYLFIYIYFFILLLDAPSVDPDVHSADCLLQPMRNEKPINEPGTNAGICSPFIFCFCFFSVFARL